GDVDGLRPFTGFADTVPPMVLIRKTTTRPAKVRYFNFFEGPYNIHADLTLTVKPIINTPAQVLSELAVDIPADDRMAGVANDKPFLFLRKQILPDQEN